MWRSGLSLGTCCLLALPLFAYTAPQAAPDEGVTSASDDSASSNETALRYSETLEVTSSRTEVSIMNAPVTVTVIQAARIEGAAATNYADLLRGVPGLNVVQTSARDVNLTSRGATRLLANGQLALLDGRSVYQDYQGFVLWDYLPVGLDEIKQIEILSGPGSAVWGANALAGVVNIRTKSPRELLGGLIHVGLGERALRSAAARWAGAGEKLSGKASASYFEQGAWPRDPELPDGAAVPPGFAVRNEGTEQKKLDLRLDHTTIDRNWSFRTGYAGSTGITITSIGPFSTRPGAYIAYVEADYDGGPVEARVYWNGIGGESVNLLNGVRQSFGADTYVGEATAHRALGRKHAIVFGGNARFNRFDLSLAPGGDARNDAGAFAEDRVFLAPKLELVAGARLDYFDTVGAVVSPRASVLFKPSARQSVRASYSRAYRPPSMVENYLESVVPTAVSLAPSLPPFVFPVHSSGNLELREEGIGAFEIGYTMSLGDRTTLVAALYRNVTRNLIEFFPVQYYGPSEPPPAWPLDASLVPPLTLPRAFSFANVGKVRAQGFEFGVHARWARGLDAALSYTFQDRSESTPSGPAPLELNQPPRHKGGLTLGWDRGRFRGSAGLTYTDRAFWSDVLDARFWGETGGYLLLDCSTTVRLRGGKTEIGVAGTNLLDARAKQHVFGDVIGRLVRIDLRVRF